MGTLDLVPSPSIVNGGDVELYASRPRPVRRSRPKPRTYPGLSAAWLASPQRDRERFLQLHGASVLDTMEAMWPVRD
jgi:hypothetical protein